MLLIMLVLYFFIFTACFGHPGPGSVDHYQGIADIANEVEQRHLADDFLKEWDFMTSKWLVCQAYYAYYIIRYKSSPAQKPF